MVIQTDVSNLVFYAQSTIAVISGRMNRRKYKHTGKQLMTIPIVTAATNHDMYMQHEAATTTQIKKCINRTDSLDSQHQNTYNTCIYSCCHRYIYKKYIHTCESHNVATLSTSWRSVQQIAPSVGDSPVHVPLGTVNKFSHIQQNLLRQTPLQDHWAQWPFSPRITKGTPLSSHGGVHDGLSFLTLES